VIQWKLKRPKDLLAGGSIRRRREDRSVAKLLSE
jgi:hypothetical protein